MAERNTSFPQTTRPTKLKLILTTLSIHLIHNRNTAENYFKNEGVRWVTKRASSPLTRFFFGATRINTGVKKKSLASW